MPCAKVLEGAFWEWPVVHFDWNDMDNGEAPEVVSGSKNVQSLTDQVIDFCALS